MLRSLRCSVVSVTRSPSSRADLPPLSASSVRQRLIHQSSAALLASPSRQPPPPLPSVSSSPARVSLHRALSVGSLAPLPLSLSQHGRVAPACPPPLRRAPHRDTDGRVVLSAASGARGCLLDERCVLFVPGFQRRANVISCVLRRAGVHFRRGSDPCIRLLRVCVFFCDQSDEAFFRFSS